MGQSGIGKDKWTAPEAYRSRGSSPLGPTE